MEGTVFVFGFYVCSLGGNIRLFRDVVSFYFVGYSDVSGLYVVLLAFLV